MTEFLNSTPNMLYNIGLVELEVYKLSENEKLVVPNLIMKTNIIERGVFRFENGAIISVAPEDNEPEEINVKTKIRISKDDLIKLSITKQEDFVKLLVQNNPQIREDDISKFLVDLIDLGFIISPYGKTDLKIKYLLPGGNNYLNIFYLLTEKNGRAFINTNTLGNDLEKFGYSREIAATFNKDMECFHDHLLNQGNTLDIKVEKMLKDRDVVIAALDRLRSNF